MPSPMAVLHEVGGGLESGQARAIGRWHVLGGKAGILDGGSVGDFVGWKVTIRKVNHSLRSTSFLQSSLNELHTYNNNSNTIIVSNNNKKAMTEHLWDVDIEKQVDEIKNDSPETSTTQLNR